MDLGWAGRWRGLAADGGWVHVALVRTGYRFMQYHTVQDMLSAEGQMHASSHSNLCVEPAQLVAASHWLA
jgi:hypothetical protein